MNINDVTLICKALSDMKRVQIVQMIAKEEKCAADILDEFDITQPTMSHHMKVLCDCGIVNCVKKGKWSQYSVNWNRFKEFTAFLTDIAI